MKKNTDPGRQESGEYATLGRSAAPREEGGDRTDPFFYRSVVLVLMFIVICVAYGATLFGITSGYDGSQNTPERVTTQKTVKVPAVRGEIFDRNGKALVSNVYSYELRLVYGRLSDGYAKQNADIARLMNFLRQRGLREQVEFTSCPLKGTYPYYEYNTEVLESSLAVSRLSRIREGLGLRETDTASAIAAAIAEKYRMTDGEGQPLFSPEEMTDLIAFRYEAEAIRFAPSEPMTLLRELDSELVTGLRELAVPGTELTLTYERVYNYPGIASHILGRVGKIPAGEVDIYTAQGYPINATVGLEGCEKAFESYLRGTDGETLITYDEDGNKLAETVVTEPVPGKDVWLTLDIDLQIAAEEALEKDIRFVVAESAKTAGIHDGEDCDAGAMVVQEVGTGAVLAMASYPTYNLVTFSEDYTKLLNNPQKPLLNRALNGTYAPGSTFKVGVAAGALTDGTVMEDGSRFTASTLISTQGIYTYYSDYQPACWVYAYGHAKHGKINVTKALEVSCNCFFYELGRCMGIDNINKYCRIYGLGQPTGIELGESVGVLADRSYAVSIGNVWTGGLTIQTAIGQAYNRFTPIQLSGYLGTIVDGGERYAAHLLSEVREFGGKTVYTYEPTVLSSFEMTSAVRSTLINAMSRVVDENTSVTAFDGFRIKVGGKTGTAEVSGQSENGVFIGFAPLEAPEITVACVLERGAHGSNAAFAVRDVMEQYFAGR